MRLLSEILRGLFGVSAESDEVCIAKYVFSIVERSIRIVVPLNNRENISDPTSPVRTNFVYHLSDVCKKCDPVEVELEDQVVTATQSTICSEDSGVPETCYMYDRNKCYTAMVPLRYHGETKMVQAALTPDSCYPD